MGNQTGSLKNPDELIKFLLPHLSYSKTLNDAPLVKSTLCSTQNEGHIVVKFFMKEFINIDSKQIQSENQLQIELDKMKQIQEKIDLIKNPNVLALSPLLIKKEKENFLVAQRQLIYFSLLQKSRNKIPKLTIIEKKWFIFQLLCAVTQIHTQNPAIIHGDIKPDNILITSSNQLFLTDLVCYKPAYIDSEDTKSYNLYFGELENNKRCYFAPERFCDSNYDQNKRDNENLKKSMDIFSVACVIYEIMMDGVELFNRGSLIKYKTLNNQQEIRATLKKKINDKVLVDLIMRMISLKENERPQIQECLAILCQQQVFPNSFQQSLFQINSTFVMPQYLFSDLKISLFRKYMPCIWKLCFPKSEFPKFLEPQEREISSKIIDDGIIERAQQMIPSKELYLNTIYENLHLFDFLELSSCYDKNNQIFKIGQINEQNANNNINLNEQRDSAIILIHWIGTFLQTCFYPQSRRCALEMLMLIGRESSLQVRLQIILPYILKNFEDKQPRVQAKAIEAAVLIFENLVYPTESQISEKYTLSSMDYRVFNNFIMPQFKILMEKKQYKDIQIVQLTLAKYLPLLSKIGHRFTELSVASRLQRKHHHQIQIQDDKQIQNDENDGQVDEEDEMSDNEENYKYQRQNNNYHQFKQEHDNTEAQVNFDKDIDELRRDFIKIISDYADSHDPSIKRILFSKIGQQSEFFGSKMSTDSLIPLLLTCANEKEFKIKIDSLKSVVSIGIKVGKQTFTQYILPVFQTFLNEDELVVLEFIRTLSSLTQMNLLQKPTLFSDYQVNKQIQSEQLSLLDQMLPLLLHPNAWIREETLHFIKSLFDFKNGTFNKTEVFCLLRSKLAPFFNEKSSVFYLMDEKKEAHELLEVLKPPLSRSTYEMYIEAENRSYDHEDGFKHSQNDSYAIKIMNDYLKLMKIQNQRKALMNSDQKKNVALFKSQNDFWKQCKAYNLYRVINMKTLIQQKENNSENKKQQIYSQIKLNQLDYSNEFFEPCSKLDDEQNTKNGLSQIDFIMQALNLYPEDDQIKLSEQVKNDLFNAISNQSLPLNWRLQLEKLEYQCAQPSEIPQFHSQYSRTTSIVVEQNESRDRLGEQRANLEKFRPKGRLLTTLHEHSQPVSSVAVCEDQQMFITASREDGNVRIWSSKDVIKDPTAQSIQSIKADCKINQICSVQNSQIFALAGSDSTLQIYDINRLIQKNQFQENKQNDIYSINKNASNSELIQQISADSEIHKGEGELMTCLNTILPVSHQHLIAYSSQKGSFFMHDIRCNKPFLKQKNIFAQQKGMITCMSAGQDPYQILCGSIGGYVSVYDIRFNLVSSQFKHSQRYPISSLAAFKPSDKQEFPFSPGLNISKNYNKSQFFSPMALVSLGGPSFEVSLLNLDTGDIEIMMTVNEANSQSSDNQIGITPPSFLRDSLIRDSFSWPEKSENNQSLFKRLQMQAKSTLGSLQIKLNKNIDDDLYKGSKLLYKMLKESSESQNVCRKILIPRRFRSLIQNTQTVDYAIMGGNDMRLRYFNVTDPCNLSYFINTPNNDEAQYFSSQLAGGILYIKEQISKIKNFPRVNMNMFSENVKKDKLTIPNTPIELAEDSIYYNVLCDIINNKYSQDKEGLKSCIGVKNLLGQSSSMDVNMNSANKFQLEIDNDKVVIFNYNGVSEWQHFNGTHLYEGNSSIINNSFKDKWGGSNKANQGSNQGSSKIGNNDNYQESYFKQYRQGEGAPEFQDKYNESIRDYVYQESTNVSHSDAILDIEILDLINAPLIITCGRDCTVKLWQ